GRHGILVAVLLATIFLAWGGWHLLPRRGPSEASDKGARPAVSGLNVLLVSIDTCRADRLSCYGYKRQTTPNIDALAHDGAIFKMALTPVPITTPAHSSMLTGTYPPTHGVHLNAYDHLADSNVTLAKILREAGYQTAAFVAAFPLNSRFGLNQGFETYDGRFDEEHEIKGGISRRQGEEVSRLAMAWLKDHAQKPFFLFLHYYDAHLPNDPHPPYVSEYTDDPYAREIAYVDNCIGQVLDRLRALGVYDNTLVIITGDHGEGLGEHGEPTHCYFVYQSTLHVPLVIRAPGCSKGIQVDGNVSLVDIFPTVLDLIGLKTESRVDGMDLRPALEGGLAADRQRAVYAESLEAETFGCSPLHGIVEGPWKYILAPRPELYDLGQDPGELTNLAGKEPQMAQRLRGRLEAIFKELKSAAPQSNPSTADPADIKRLESLGYVSGGSTPTDSDLDTTCEDAKDFLPTYLRCVHALAQFEDGRTKENEKAKKELLEIVASRPELIMPHRLLALIALDERRPADAAAHAAKIVAILEESKDIPKQPLRARQKLAMAHCILGLALQAMGKLSEATAHYEQALRIKPDYAEVHVNLGLALQAMGKLPEATAHWEQALRIAPDQADAHLNLGNVLGQAGKLAEAIAHYEQALQIKPDYALVHVNLGITLAQSGKFSEAIGHYEQALRIQPDLAQSDRDLKPALAEAQSMMAIEHYEQVLRTKPDDAAAHSDLGNLLERTARVPEAIWHYEQALRSRPDDAAIHYNLALALGLEGNAAEAAKHYAEALRLQADLLGAMNNLAWIRATSEDARLRDGPEAVRLAERARQVTAHRDPNVLATLAAAYAEAGRFPEAIAAAEEALALAQAAKQSELAMAIQSHLDLYRAGRPYREPAVKPTRGP
ncbi:MAG: sulfatase-like hydrolase/transferase, partial [Thermoguttaceae bacterium]